MNRKGFTLVEVLIAGVLFVAAFACFGELLKISLCCLKKAETKARELYLARSELERLRSIPFGSLASAAAAGTTVTLIADDLYLIGAGGLYTLRSKYR